MLLAAVLSFVLLLPAGAAWAPLLHPNDSGVTYIEVTEGLDRF